MALHEHRLDNGLQLVAEPIAGARSLALTLLVPAGVAVEPAEHQGASAVLSDMLFRGAAGKSARQWSDALDLLGVQRGSGAQTHHLRVGATMIGRHLRAALPLLADAVVQPNLEASAFEPSRELALAAIDALDDEPQQRVMLELRRRFNPAPLGRSPLGVREHLALMTAEDVRAFWQNRVVPAGAILGVAGAFDFDELRDCVARSFERWHGSAAPAAADAEAQRGYHHETAETSQVHLAVAYDAVAEPDPRSELQKAAVAMLSGGMSGRLFTEVREKRGLCYSVYAAYQGQQDRGGVVSYAGTTAARAQETLDVLVGELKRLSDGVARDEFERAIVGMKARLVMQGESTSARAAAIAGDLFLLGRARTLEESAARVDAVTLDDLNDFVRSHRPADLTVVTIGPRPLRAG